jgi:Carboxypeptidase regulatory-like domain/PDZ domain
MTLSVSVRAELKRRVSAWFRWARPVLAALAVVLVVGGVPGARPNPFVLPLRTAPQLPPDESGRDARVVATLRTESGKPIANGRVQAFAIVDGAAYAAGAATSDAAGRAVVDELPHGEHWLVADAEGFARASSHVILSVGERDVDFVLGAEHKLDVAVKDERGAVVANAEIEVTGVDPLPVGARAGDDGAIVVGRLGKGPFLVTARAPGYEEVTQRGVKEGDHVTFTLRRLGAIVARVVDLAGQAVVGAEVAIAGATLWPARIGETDKTGALRVGSLSAGSYALRATRGRGVSPTELGIMLARGEEKTVTLTVAPGRTVAVRVMDGDGDDAGPIAGARLSLVEGGLSPFPIEAKSGRDGRAHLGPIAPGAATLAARADGFVPRGSIPVADEGGKELVVSLVRAGVLTGRVVDTRGFPVDGATIEVVGTDFYGAPISDDPRRTGFREAHFEAMLSGPTQLVPAGELGVVPGPVPPIPHAFSSGGAASLGVARSSDDFAEPWVSRDDGTFRCAPVSPGRIRAFVHHPQYVETMSDAVSLASGGEAHVEVVMHAGGWLDGRVVDTRGAGVAGARVQIAARHGTVERSTKTATDGTFAFAAVPESVVVSVFQDDDANEPAARETVSIPERETRSVTLTLPDARPPLPATVRDDRGYPIEGAQLTARSLDPAAPLRTTVFTNARGEAQIKGAKGVELRIEVSAPGHAPKVADVAPAVEALALVLGIAETATGEVRSSRGDRVEGAEIVLYTNLGARHARTAADGTFAMKDLAAGAATLRVHAAGFASAARELTIPDSNGAHPFEIPRIELTEGGTVEGVVVDARGDPVQGARVALDRAPTYLAVGATPPGVAVTDADGRFKLGELPEGELTLEAYAPDVGRARVSGVHVSAGRRTLNLRITVRKEDGESRDPGASGGVAVTLGETSEEVVLVGVAQGSEAERAGLAPDDVVVSVDGVAVHTIEEARGRLNGPISDDVVIKVRRSDGDETFRVGREQVRR